MELVNKNLSKMGMCNAIISIIPPDLAYAYWTTKGSSHFPLCVTTLIDNLDFLGRQIVNEGRDAQRDLRT